MLDAGLNIGLNIGLDAGLGTYTILLLEASCWHVSNQVGYIEHVMANRIKSVADPEAYFTALVGPHAPDTNNILLAEVDDSSVAGTLISDYVGYLLSMKINVHVLQEFFFNTPGLKENRSVEGWFFEAKFFSLVSRSQNQSITLFTSGKFCSDLSLFSF